MSRFNLIDENWIPVRFTDGTRKELGIRQTLLRAGEIEAIEDPSPLVVAALHRFLLAILYRSLEGPTDIQQAKALFKRGLPSKKITSYLKKWRDRFWLFDEKYPFGQNPNVPKEAIEPWTKLTPEHNARSSKVLFDHTNMKKLGSREPKKCARWLLSTMNFSISGGRGYYPSPSPNAMMCIPLGRNLEATLCYCLVPYPNRKAMKEDSALWEHEPKMLPLDTPKQVSFGYADLYTWQPRMILLKEESTGGVTTMRFVAGQSFENPSNNPDPMQPYKINKTKGKLPVQFIANRGIWRGFDSLLPDNTELAPLTVQNALKLAGKNIDSMPESFMVLGLKYQPPNANVDFWRMECFALPEALAGDRLIRKEIRQLLTDAEDAQKALWLACSIFARDLLSRGERKPAGTDISALVEQMPVIPDYWFALESRFHSTLRTYSLGRDPDDIRSQWLESVRDTLQTVWRQHAISVSMRDAWAIRALVKAEGPLRRKLKELYEEIIELKPEKEKT